MILMSICSFLKQQTSTFCTHFFSILSDYCELIPHHISPEPVIFAFVEYRKTFSTKNRKGANLFFLQKNNTIHFRQQTLIFFLSHIHDVSTYSKLTILFELMHISQYSACEFVKLTLNLNFEFFFFFFFCFIIIEASKNQKHLLLF